MIALTGVMLTYRGKVGMLDGQVIINCTRSTRAIHQAGSRKRLRCPLFSYSRYRIVVIDCHTPVRPCQPATTPRCLWHEINPGAWQRRLNSGPCPWPPHAWQAQWALLTVHDTPLPPRGSVAHVCVCVVVCMGEGGPHTLCCMRARRKGCSCAPALPAQTPALDPGLKNHNPAP